VGASVRSRSMASSCRPIGGRRALLNRHIAVTVVRVYSRITMFSFITDLVQFTSRPVTRRNHDGCFEQSAENAVNRKYRTAYYNHMPSVPWAAVH